MQPIRTDILTVAPPRVITVTITEEDRQKAEHFCDRGQCILGTALERMGYTGLRIYTHGVKINGAYFKANPKWDASDACFNTGACYKPLYGPEVVGKTIVLTRKEAA